MTEDPKELVARLRNKVGRFSNGPLMDEAADLIDRLTADRERSVPEDVVERVARALAESNGWRWDGERSQMVEFAASGQPTQRSRNWWRNNARAAIAATPSRIPAGFVLVPVVPTEAMIDRFVSRALCVSVHGEGSWSNYARNQWSAMIAAAPAPALPETGVER